jgi:hypothetical protein
MIIAQTRVLLAELFDLYAPIFFIPKRTVNCNFSDISRMHRHGVNRQLVRASKKKKGNKKILCQYATRFDQNRNQKVAAIKIVHQSLPPDSSKLSNRK